jgi:hypothetical protein
MADENRITVFAKTNFRNQEVPFGIKTDDRRRHMYLVGKTGMGKTSLMENMVIQDIRNGHGVAFLDPHGDSVQKILNAVPASRINDVIYFNPADMEFPMAFNILEAVDNKYKHLVASGLMGVFTKIWANLWSARMEYILNNTILALLDSPGNTMLGIPRMYVDKKYRKKIVDNIKDPMVRAFWVDEFANYAEKYRTEAVAPIQNKVGQFLSSGIIRNIVGQPRSTIDLREVMDNQKILIMDLSKGKVGEDNSALLGAMLVTKLQLAAMSRTDIPEAERKDFYLYVDEFQNFATESFATILSEARKYRLNLIVGHQYIAQLEQDKSTKVRDAIFGNVGTIILFRIGAADAEFLETEFDPTFTPGDMVNLPKYSIILKLMINGVASEPFSASTLAPNPNFVTGNADKVIKVSRERYSNPVLEVEDKIARWMGAEVMQETAVFLGAAEGQDAEMEPERPATIQKSLQQQNRIFEPPTVPQPPVPRVPFQASVAPVIVDKPLVSEPEAHHADPEPLGVIPSTPSPVEHSDTSSVQNFSAPVIIEQKNNTPPAPAQPVVFKSEQRANVVSSNQYSKPPSRNEPSRQPSRQSSPNSLPNRDRQPMRRENQRDNQRDGNRPQHQRMNDRKPEKKNENPIWNTVASLHQEKVKQEEKKVGEVVTQAFKISSQKPVQEKPLQQEPMQKSGPSADQQNSQSFFAEDRGDHQDTHPANPAPVVRESSAPEHSQTIPQAVVNPQQPAERKVLQPGQSQKF